MRKSVIIAFLVILPTGWANAALRPILIGKHASPKIARLTHEEVNGNTSAGETLHLVVSAPYEIWSKDGTYIHVVAYRPDFSAASNAVIYLDEKPVGVTDTRGVLVFRHVPTVPPPRPDGGYRVVTGIWGQGETRAVGRLGFETLARTHQSTRQQIFVYTDKLLYAPGQSVHVRAISWQLTKQYEPITQTPVDVTLWNDKRKLAGCAQLLTDDYGAGALTLPLADTQPDGSYQLEARIGDTVSVAQITVRRPGHDAGEAVPADAGVGQPTTETSAKPNQGSSDASAPMRVVLPGSTRERVNVPIEVLFAKGYTPAERFVHGNVVDSSGSLVTAFALPITKKETHFAASGRIGAPSWGAMLITVWCTGAPNDATDAQQTAESVGLVTQGAYLPVTPTQALNVSLSGIPTTARPGQKLTIRGRITDAAGVGRTARVSVSVMDSALQDSVSRGEPDPGAQYYAAGGKVLAVTGDPRPTWPVTSRNWGRQQMDVTTPPNTLGRLRPEAAVKASKRKFTNGDSEREIVMWKEEMNAPGGWFAISTTLPTQMRTHRVSVVASDKRGGIGVASADIRVAEPVFLETQSVTSMRVGESVALRAKIVNSGSAVISGTLSMQLKGFESPIQDPIPIEVAPGETRIEELEVVAVQMGSGSYTLRAKGPGFDKKLRRDVAIIPAGTSDTRRFVGAATREHPFEHTVTLAEGDRAWLRVTPPVVGIIGETLLSLEIAGVRGQGDLGSRAEAAHHLAVTLTESGKLNESRAIRLRDIIAADVMKILNRTHRGAVKVQGNPSPYLTARALRGLFSARETGFPIPQENLAAVGNALLSWVNDEGSIAVDDPAWWPGPVADARLALSAFVFRALAEAGQEAVSTEMSGAFEKLGTRVKRAVNLTSDPMTIGNAGLGLLAYSNKFLGVPMDAPTARRLRRRLLEEVQTGHWRPAWFQADLGTISTTATALELLYAIDPESAGPLLLDAFNALEAARHRVGPGHIGEAAADVARMVSRVPIAQDPHRISVGVEIAGRRVLRHYVGAGDHETSAKQLSHVDLTPFASSGTHDVRITYNGVLSAAASISVEHMVASTPAGAPQVIRRRISPTEVGAGETTTVELALVSGSSITNVALEEPLPLGATIGRASLERLRLQGTISAYDISDTLLLYVPLLKAEQPLAYEVRVAGKGQAIIPPTRMHAVQRPEDSSVVGETTKLSVR